MAEKDYMYATTAVNTGGRDGESHLADRSFEVRVSTPKDMGGPGQGTNPEQLFALGYSGCYHSALEHYKSEENITNESQVTTTVYLLKDPTDNGFKLAVKHEVALKGLELDKVQELADKAQQFCPYSKATQNNIDVEVKAVEYEEGK